MREWRVLTETERRWAEQQVNLDVARYLGSERADLARELLGGTETLPTRVDLGVLT